MTPDHPVRPLDGLEPQQQPSLVLIESDLLGAEAQGAERRCGLVSADISACRAAKVSCAQPLEPVPQSLLSIVGGASALYEPQGIACDLDLVVVEDHASHSLIGRGTRRLRQRPHVVPGQASA